MHGWMGGFLLFWVVGLTQERERDRVRRNGMCESESEEIRRDQSRVTRLGGGRCEGVKCVAIYLSKYT